MRFRTFGPWLFYSWICGLIWSLPLGVAPAASELAREPRPSSETTPSTVPTTASGADPRTSASAHDSATPDGAMGPARGLAEAAEPAATRAVLLDVLARNPEIVHGERLAAAAAARAPQVRALPDPEASLTAFVAPPETRVGPQVARLSVRQTLPWFGKLRFAERAALLSALAAELAVEEVRLESVTEARRLLYELTFLDRREAILEEEQAVLHRAESLAHSRYVSGTGVQQTILRLQAAVTRIDARRLEIAGRRAALINALERLGGAAVPSRGLEADRWFAAERASLEGDSPLDAADWLAEALARRPVIKALDAEIAAAGALGDLASLASRPDVKVGLSYTVVDPRGGLDGGAPPRGDGDDIVAVDVSVPLPWQRRKIAAGIQEAAARQQAAEAAREAKVAEIEAAIGERVARIPYLMEHLELLDRVLLKQASRALESAESAYAAGSLEALEVLDAEQVLFELRLAAERTRTDLAIARAELEREIAGSLLRVDRPSEGASDDF